MNTVEGVDCSLNTAEVHLFLESKKPGLSGYWKTHENDSFLRNSEYW